MLSRRMLYCTYREFQFECRQGKTCECENPFMPPHPAPKTLASRAMLQVKGDYAELEKLHGVKGNYAVHKELRITQSSDKLPALSGCAKDVGRITEDGYLAGIWRTRFAEGLLWVVNVPVNQPRANVWRAPSWSWASVDTTNGINYAYPRKTRYRQAFQDKIEAVECTPAGLDKTGAVKSGHLTLRTSPYPTYLRRICRQCQASRSPNRYTIESDHWYSTRNPRITPCPSIGIQGLKLRYITPSFFPDYKYDNIIDFDSQDRSDGHGCMHAPVFLLHLYDCQSFASYIITEFFLVLKK
ncbi:hypothetical protein FZEAL_7520 [Fusarium zealandicum]|uniref:Uncharacterized protein n=1 Tax=Fusarium zealandicum TaxID=1053134 RepID=A0A8H4UFK6_9HYPO|nr:hypothetical protein FZEAL_7520 [Fusarium zealandicum]